MHTIAPLGFAPVWEAAASAREGGGFCGQDGVERASRDLAPYIAEAGIFEQTAVLAQSAFFAFRAHQHIQ